MKFLVPAIVLFCSISVWSQECTTKIILGAFGDEHQPVKVRPADLEARVDGKRVEIANIQPLAPRRFVIVLDTSSATAKNDIPDWTYSNTVRVYKNVINWIFLKSIAESLVTKAPPGVGIGVVGVGSGPIETVEINKNRKATIDAINGFGDGISPFGPHYNLGEKNAGIRSANELFDAAEEGDFTVSVSDWAVSAGRDLGRDLPAMMIRNSRRLFAIHVLYRYPKDDHEIYYGDNPLRTLTKQTGGLRLETFLPEKPEDVDPVASKLASKVIDAAFGYHQLELKVEPSRKTRKLKISAPEAVKQLAYVAVVPPCVSRPEPEVTPGDLNK